MSKELIRDIAKGAERRPRDHYKSPHPLPTPREREIIDVLQEECAEVVVIASKFKRFGAGDSYPPRYPEPNFEKLAEECGHVLAMIDICLAAGLIKERELQTGRQDKFVKLAKFLQT